MGRTELEGGEADRTPTLKRFRSLRKITHQTGSLGTGTFLEGCNDDIGNADFDDDTIADTVGRHPDCNDDSGT